MKIAIAMKSNFAKERLVTMFEKNQVVIKGGEIYQQNIQTQELLDDVIEFWIPDILILDAKLPNYDDIKHFAERFDLPILYFQSDFETTTEQVISMLPGPVIDDEVEESESTKENIKYIVKTQEKEPEIIYKDRVIEKEIIKTSYSSIPNKLIVVASMWSGAGSTTFASNLARSIADRGLNVAYVEHPLLKPYMFDYLSIPSKEVEYEKNYTDLAKKIANKKVFKRKADFWREHDIDWYVVDSREEPLEIFSYENLLKFIYSINSTITIVDVSARLDDPAVKNLLHHADDIYVCIEPDPVKLDWLSEVQSQDGKEAKQRTEKEVIDFLNHIQKKEGLDYEYIQMKHTKKIDNVTLWESLEKKPISFFPVVHYEDLIQMVWDSQIMYDVSEYRDLVEKAMKPVITRTIPRQFYESRKQNSHIAKKLINMFSKGES